MTQSYEAIILRKREWGESDLLLTVLTNQGEKKEWVVKGGAAASSRRRAHLEPLNLIRASIHSSPRHDYLSEVSSISSFRHLKEKIDLLYRLSLLVELLVSAFPLEDSEPQIYQLLSETLTRLDQSPSPVFLPEIALIKLAHLLGFLPSFRECSHCHQTLSTDAHWDSETGLLCCPSCQKIPCPCLPLKYRKAFEFFRSASHAECLKVRLSSEETTDLQNWIPQFISRYLEKPHLSWVPVQA